MQWRRRDLAVIGQIWRREYTERLR